MASKQRGVRGRDTLTPAQIAVLVGVGAMLPSPDGLTVVVNPGHPLAADDTDRGTPFLTIQGAENAKPAPPTSPADAAPYNVLIMPLDYDDAGAPGTALALDVTRQTNLIGIGPFGIGTFDGVDRAPSGPARNINVSASPPVAGVRAGLSIDCLPILGDAMTTHQSYMTKPRVSGDIDFSGAAGAGSVEFLLGAEVFGDMIGGAAILQSYIKYSRIRGVVNGVNWNFQVAERSRFQGLVTCTGYSRIAYSRLDAAMAPASTPAGIEPSGITNSRIRGSWAGPAACRADGYTLRSFVPGGAVLGGGSLVSLDSTPPIVFGAGGIGVAAGTLYLFPGYSTATAQASPVEWVAPRPGVIFGLRVRQLASVGGQTITYVALVNGASALSLDMLNTATDGTADPTQLRAVAAGDRVSFAKSTGGILGGSPTNIAASFLFA